MKEISRLVWALCALFTLSFGTVSAQELFPAGTAWRYVKGTGPASSPDPTAWRQPGFADTEWAQGDAAFYYGDPFTGTLLSDMQGSYSTVFLRKRFTVTNPADFKSANLRAACDDGFIAWINGQEVMRFNVPEGELDHTGTALGPANPDPAVFNDYPVANPKEVFVAGDNTIAVQLFNASLSGSSDIVWDAALLAEVDMENPTVVSVTPPAGATVRELFAVEILFSEPVNGVEAADLRINGVGATNVSEITPGQFVFSFPSVPAGPVTVAFRADHGITDQASTPRPFSGGSWNYTVNPNSRPPGVMISEFMADNDGGIRDEDGDESDWIELHNSSNQSVSLLNWSLTDESAKPGKWKFPNLTLPAGGYLVVFASEKDRTNTAGRLHANFKLNNEGEYLALVSPSGTVESAFAPYYPQQRENISYGRANGAPDVVGFFEKATPGSANLTSGSGFAPGVRFSRLGGTYTTDFELALSLAEPAAGAVIRYTVDRSLPTETSPIYSSPIAITNSIQIRARAFAPGLLAGEAHSEMFLKLEGTVPTFTSDLPVMILHNFGGRRPPATGQQPAYLQVFEPLNGVTSLTNRPTLTSRVGIGARGSSTLGYSKVSMNLELRDEFDADDDRELLGLPSDSDWVLYAPNNFEPILIHNPFAHQLSRDIGRYSPRTRWVEVYLVSDTANGTVRTTTYQGIYVLEERITRSNDRVDVDKLEPEHTKAPEVTGGYLLKVDRTGPGEGGFYAANQGMVYVDPSEEEIFRPERSAQRQYLQTYFDSFGNALYGANWKNPTTGYRAYIDVDAWIDHSLLNVLTFNVDALRLSAYFHKPRSGKITFGPLWDFDRALNSTDGRDANPRVWSAANGSGTDFFNETTQAWWGRLFNDIDFFQLWIDRYQDLRRSHFSTTNLWRLTDELAGQVRNAQPREFNKWRVPLRGGTYQSEVNLLRNWLSNRVTFMDGQFIRRPTNSAPGGRFADPVSVTLTGPTNGTIYYTLDGTDPRLAGGGVRATAKIAGGTPIVISSNARLVARVNNNAHTARTGAGDPPLVSKWSGVTATTYFNVIPPLLLTEIMFHPADPPAGSPYDAELFEFVELRNTSDTTLNLIGFKLTGGIEYTFAATSSVTTLAPGARVLVVRNRAAFLSRYPAATGIAGEFTGGLSNSGNTIRVVGPLEEPVSAVSYTDAWAPLADGFGFSLVLRNEATSPEQIGTADQWRLSAAVGGSPGAADGTPATLPGILVNEVLTHTDPPLLDTVELFNPGAVTANISGWWLTDDYREPKKYRLPTSSSIEAGKHLLITEEQFRPGTTGFSLNALGDEVHLFSANEAGDLTGYYHGFAFSAAFNGVSFGRFVTSDGDEHFVPQTQRTLGTANSGPVIGPLVITEIHFAPALNGTANNTDDEFIEVRNATAAPLPLFDPQSPTNHWRLRGAVDFDFPADVTLPAGGFALVVNFDPLQEDGPAAAFRAKFNVPTDVKLFGPWVGTLNNAGETVQLQQPDEPVGAPAPNEGEVPFVTSESIAYQPVTPWPTGAVESGKSLQRLRSLNFGDEPANWETANPTAGRVNNPGDTITTDADADADGLPDDWEAQYNLSTSSGTGDNGAAGDPDGDGFVNRDEYVAGTHPKDGNSALRVAASATGGGVGLQFSAVAGRSYTVWVRDSLTAGDWQVLANFPTQATSGVLSAPDNSGLAPRFYQITVSFP